MKKTLAVAAVLAAFAGSAAADVTVYGKVDMGLLWTNTGDSDKFELASNAGGNTSRVGFKGAEKIGDMTVGFNYEIGLTPDDGKHTGKEAERLLNRVAQVYVKGAYGELGAGYYGALDASTGPYSITGNASAAGTGWAGNILDQGFVIKTNSRIENAVTYKSPAFAGATVYAQVGSSAAYSDDANMYYALGVDYKAGNFGAFLTASTTETGKAAAAKAGNEDKNFVAGVNYDFGVAKAYLGANYYETGVKGQDQYGVVASVKAPVFGGTGYVSAGYGEVSDDEAGDETKMYFGVGYQYNLSKQTFLYAAANWSQSDKTEVYNATEKAFGAEVNTTEVAVGIVHNF